MINCYFVSLSCKFNPRLYVFFPLSFYGTFPVHALLCIFFFSFFFSFLFFSFFFFFGGGGGVAVIGMGTPFRLQLFLKFTVSFCFFANHFLLNLPFSAICIYAYSDFQLSVSKPNACEQVMDQSIETPAPRPPEHSRGVTGTWPWKYALQRCISPWVRGQ